jgi:hypothetical protein
VSALWACSGPFTDNTVVNRYHLQGDSETSIAIIALTLAMIVKKAGDFSMGEALAKAYPLFPEEESGETRS